MADPTAALRRAADRLDAALEARDAAIHAAAAAGLTQAAIGDAVRLHRVQVNRILNGRSGAARGGS